MDTVKLRDRLACLLWLAAGLLIWHKWAFGGGVSGTVWIAYGWSYLGLVVFLVMNNWDNDKENE